MENALPQVAHFHPPLTGTLCPPLDNMAEGKKKASLQSFFDRLSEPQKRRIVAVGMDRAGAYRKVVKAELPEADIVFDRFHLIANYHAVIDAIRRSEWREASAEDKNVIKGQSSWFDGATQLRGRDRAAGTA